MSDFERKAAPASSAGSRSSSPTATGAGNTTGGRHSPRSSQPQHHKRRSSFQVVIDTLADVGSHVKAALSGADYEMTCGNIPLDVRADPASRFVVIGAGPAGIHMAYLLKRAGYSDVTVLEASNNIGGRARTSSFKGTVGGVKPHHRSRVHIGAWHFRQCDLRHSALASLIEELGLTASLRPIAIYGRKDDGRGGFTANGAGSPTAAAVVEGSVAEGEEQQAASKPLWHRRAGSGAPSPKHGDGSSRQGQALEARRAVLAKALHSYAALRKAVLGHSKGLLPRMGGGGPRGGGDEDGQLLADVHSLSFLGLLQKRRLDVLLPCFELANTAAGYGPLSGMPAWQGLVFHTPDSAEHVVRDGELVPVYRGSMLVGGGVMGLLEAMVRREQIKVVCGVRVTRITRPPYDSAEGAGICTYLKPAAAKGEAEVAVQLPFDVVVLASNLSSATPLLADPSDEENMWSDEVVDHTLAVSLVTPTPQLQRAVDAAGGFLHTAGSEAATLRSLDAGKEGGGEEEGGGRLQAIADMRCLLLSSSTHSAEGSIEEEELPAPVLLAYQHLPRAPRPEDEAWLRKALPSDLAQLTGQADGEEGAGGAEPQVLSTFPWKAFTHLSPLALERGFLVSMFNSQGRRRTLLLGACPSSFDSVAHVLEYNERVVEALALRPTRR